jgi:hypothetical protein
LLCRTAPGCWLPRYRWGRTAVASGTVRWYWLRLAAAALCRQANPLLYPVFQDPMLSLTLQHAHPHPHPCRKLSVRQTLQLTPPAPRPSSWQLPGWQTWTCRLSSSSTATRSCPTSRTCTHPHTHPGWLDLPPPNSQTRAHLHTCARLPSSPQTSNK